MNNRIYKPRTNLLTWPLIGRLLRWRWGRLFFQGGLLVVAALMMYDGFTGPQYAPENLATVTAWVHYRGVIVFGFLLAGNLFCMGCPFTLPRTLAKRWAVQGRRWPRALRNKWMAIALLFLFLFLYEWLDLWAGPLLTAWIIVGYFVASFVLEAAFTESPFCKYVCPLGTFNFASSTISPLQITVADRDVCRQCVGKECINGRGAEPGRPVTKGKRVIRPENIQVLGCGTELFAPQITTNLDCTFCLDCARACPHENVVLGTRPLLHELRTDSWPKRWDLSLLILVFAFAGVGNAFGMVPPVFALESWLGVQIGIESEGIALLLIFGLLNLLLPVGMGLLAAVVSRAIAGRGEPLKNTLARYAPSFAPVAFGIWLAHYGGFHFLSSAATIVPVTQSFLIDHGITLFGEPNWQLAAVVPLSWLDPLEVIVILGGLLGSLYVLGERAKQTPDRPDSAGAQIPWALLLLALAAAAFWIFYLPMEMRGSSFLS